jgi:hypothetical protein
LRVGKVGGGVRVEKSADIRYASGEWKYYIAVPVLFERKADEDNAMRYRSAIVISYRKGFRRCRVRVESLELMF